MSDGMPRGRGPYKQYNRGRKFPKTSKKYYQKLKGGHTQQQPLPQRLHSTSGLGGSSLPGDRAQDNESLHDQFQMESSSDVFSTAEAGEDDYEDSEQVRMEISGEDLNEREADEDSPEGSEVEHSAPPNSLLRRRCVVEQQRRPTGQSGRSHTTPQAEVECLENQDTSSDGDDIQGVDYEDGNLAEQASQHDLGGSSDSSDIESDDNHYESQVQPPEKPAMTSTEKFRSMLREKYSERITAPVLVSKGNVLLMVLKMAKQNSMTVKGFNDTVNLVNSMFGTPILPTSKYFMDKLLKLDMGAENHYFCIGCKHYFGVYEEEEGRSLSCPECPPPNAPEGVGSEEEEETVEGGILTAHFVTFDLVNQLEIILRKLHKCGVNLYNPNDALLRDDNVISELYDGLMYKKFAREYGHPNSEVKVISLTICTDGSPLFKTSGLSIWPMWAMINEAPPDERMSNMILLALWFCKEKPNMELFLTTCAEKLQNLSCEGFTLNISEQIRWTMKAYLVACCVDSGARGSVQYISTHGGYYSCNWCEIPGEYKFGSVRYPLMAVRPPPRTSDSLIENGMAYNTAMESHERLPQDRLQRAAVHKGAKGITPLAACDSFDIVNGFIVEHAHCVYLGIVRTFASLWESMLRRKQGETEDKLKKLNERLASLRPPQEARRCDAQTLEERIKWNAKDSENFLLLFSLPTVQKLLPKKYVVHWYYLAQAMYLLLKTSLNQTDVMNAHNLLCHFCNILPDLYGEGEMTYNCHLLQHLGENVLRWGPLWAISGMAFEGANGDLKRKIKAVKGIPNQLHRHLWQERATDIILEECSSAITNEFSESIKSKQRLKKGTFTPSCNFMGKSKKLVASPRELWLCSGLSVNPKNCTVYCKIIKDKCVFTSAQKKQSQTYNAVAELDDGKIVHIQKIIMEEKSKEGFAFVNYLQCELLYRPPTGVQLNLSDLVVRKVTFECRDLQIIPLKKLKTICMYSKFLHGTFVTPMPNIKNLY